MEKGDVKFLLAFLEDETDEPSDSYVEWYDTLGEAQNARRVVRGVIFRATVVVPDIKE